MLNAEQLEIRALARDFANGEIRPHVARWDEAATLDDSIFEAMAELGFLGMLVPEEYGGLEFDLTTYLAVLEEIGWGDAAVALSVAIHSGPVAQILMAHGSEEQKREWLPRLAAGEVLGAFALSEEEAGSDAAAVSCQARRSDEAWVLSGRKKWVTNGDRAGLVVVFARTGPERHDVGCFLVDPSQTGYAVTGRTTTMGLRASETVEVELDEVTGALVGAPDQGFRYAMEAIDFGRLGVAAQALGIGRAALEYATEYALEREQFSQPIAELGAIQEKLANMAARVIGARAMTHAAGEALQASRNGASASDARGLEGGTVQAALAKLAAS
jgi:alkylation response protein AidB-like acyl-CoA dehydrogenase